MNSVICTTKWSLSNDIQVNNVTNYKKRKQSNDDQEEFHQFHNPMIANHMVEIHREKTCNNSGKTPSQRASLRLEGF
ncbi:MAG: hypothetical protein WDM78_03075 [Puia sp.]